MRMGASDEKYVDDYGFESWVSTKTLKPKVSRQGKNGKGENVHFSKKVESDMSMPGSRAVVTKVRMPQQSAHKKFMNKEMEEARTEGTVLISKEEYELLQSLKRKSELGSTSKDAEDGESATPLYLKWAYCPFKL